MLFQDCWYLVCKFVSTSLKYKLLHCYDQDFSLPNTAKCNPNNKCSLINSNYAEKINDSRSFPYI